MRNRLRSPLLFIAVSLFVIPPATWALVVYLHDEHHVFWQNPPAWLTAYFGGSVGLVVLLGRLTRRTGRETSAVVAATAGACVLVMIGAFILAVLSGSFDNLN
jgi:hypothetical protein